MAKKVEVPVWYVAVRTNSHRSITRHRDPDEQWDGDDIANDIRVEGFEVVSKDQYSDFPVSFEPVVGVTYWLVAVTYNTGSSFHREDGCMEFVSLFQHEADADRVAKEIQEHYRKYREDKVDSYSVTVTLPEGELSFYSPWCGYFERMVCVEVLPVSMNGYKKYVP